MNNCKSFAMSLVMFVVLCPLLSFAQPTSSTISPRAFGSKSWCENGIAPLSLPVIGNFLWDVMASDGGLYFWDGDSWVSIM